MDKYQKVKVLGKGSFGSAILIKRKSDGLLFVVKEVSLMKMSKKERDEARHECTVLQQLQHPNIVRYVEQFENKNNLYIVMEYCDGGDLAGKVKLSRGPMKESTVLYYFSQICLAMEYLHARHILHRDIKTMNVFLMKNGAVKLGDFGISTVLRNTMGMANTVCGTPYYFSPELCRNRPYNNKSDLWALGVLLYECATGGRHPFDGTSMNQLMQRIVKGNYAPLSSQYSADFRKMVDWCLQKDPARRPSIKQTLALPIMRQSLEQLEENLMLATQCRVRLKDIIDFESAMDQADRPKSPQSGQPAAPQPAAKAGISPGQAAALALAQRPSLQPTPQPSAAPASPSRNAGAAVVGPKPPAAGAAPASAGAAPSRAYDVHHFYNPHQRRPDANPIVADNGGRPAGQSPQLYRPPPPQQQPSTPAEVSPRAQSPRSNVNLINGYGGAGAAAASPRSPSSGGADPFHADMRRVDAIIAKYGKNTDERAKETIHAYMRRKQEAYLKKQKEDLETRERRNDLRQQELRRVLDNQRAAVSPTAQNQRPLTPQSAEQADGHGARQSPPRRVGSPQARPRSEDLPPRNRSPSSTPPRGSPAAPRSPAAPGAVAGVFGRDPRRNAGNQPSPAAPQPQRSRPTTPQWQHGPTGQRVGNAAAVSPKPSSPASQRRVVYAANSPQPEQGGQPRPQSPSRPGGVYAEALNFDWRAVANAKPVASSNAAPRRKKASSSAGLDGGIGGHRMQLQPAQPSQPRRSQELPHPSAIRDVSEALRRPSALAPLGSEGAAGHRSPRHAAPALSHELLGRGEPSAAAPDSLSPRSGADPRLQRPSRVHQGYLKPIGGRTEDRASPASSPSAGRSPRLDAIPVQERQQAASPSDAQGRHGGRCPSPPAELVDIPRAVAAPSGPVEEALRILRRRRLQNGAAAAPGGGEVVDLPALNLAAAEQAGQRRQPTRQHSGESGGYAGMSREAATRDDAQFLKEEQRRRRSEGSAVPSTLEAMRSLREQHEQAAAAGPVDQLALLKHRQRMRREGEASPPVSQSSDAALPSAQSDPAAHQERRPYTSRSSPPATTSAPVTALSLGAVKGGLSPTASPPVSQPPSKATTPTASKAAAAGGGGGGSGGPQPSSMDGYAEMLQHLKDLLQRRRVTRNAASPAVSPTAVAKAAGGSPSLSGGQQRGLPLPPPLDAQPSVAEGVPNPLLGDGAAVSPPHLKATKPQYSARPRPPPLDLPGSDDAADATADDDDDDFEDAVPLSPVRCAELNDTYARLQQQKNGVALPADVYTDDVDLTSANMEEELDGEEGYTGYYKLPSPQALLKGK